MSLLTICLTIFGIAPLASSCGLPAHLERGRTAPKTAITNVHVFDGAKFGPQTTVVLLGGMISNVNPVGATTVDGKGGYLVPGYIDAHCHVTSCAYLTTMAHYGITTALDMGTFPYSAVSGCKASGVTDVLGSSAAGTVNGTTISRIPGFPSDSFIPTPDAGRKFVADRLAEGVDYIKLFLDPLGPNDATIAAVVAAAHAAGKKVISHASSYADYSQAETGKVDIATHVPLDKPIDAPSIKSLMGAGIRVVPTLIMMHSIVNNTGAPYVAYTAAAQSSVTNIYKAGIPIAVGTDANTSPYVPANPPFGVSLHEELQLLVTAGLSPVEALNAATSVAASMFRLYDRGSIKAGLRADLVLLSADPTVDITNSKSIEKVWIAGVLSTYIA